MDESIIKPEVYRSERFRTPAGLELELGLWVDRIGMNREAPETGKGLHGEALRILGLFAAVQAVSGNGFYESSETGRLPVEEGDIMLVQPETPCKYGPRSGVWTQRFIVWGGPRARTLCKAILPAATPKAPILRKAGGAFMDAAYERLSLLMDDGRLDAAYERMLTLERMLLDISRASSVSGKTDDAIARAMETLSSAESRIDMRRLAKGCGLSEAHFRRLFKAQTGLPPRDFALAARVNRAKSLLREGSSIKETAELCGFHDVFHFMRSFKKIAGCTAGAYART